MATTINQQGFNTQQLNTEELRKLKPSEQLRQKGVTGPLTQEQAAQISVFLPEQMTGKYSQTTLSEIKYGFGKGDISQEDYDKAVKGENMSTDGETALKTWQQKFQVNWATLLEFFTNNDKVGENGESLTEEENEQIDNLMTNDTYGFITEEELEGVDESLAEKAKEAAEEAEKAGEEAPAAEEKPKGDEDREKQVNDAFDAFMKDYENGGNYDYSKYEGTGITKSDYEGIVADYKDDKIIGNGAMKDQFESNNVSPYAAKLAKASESSNIKEEDRIQGIYDNNEDEKNKMRYERKKENQY